MVMGVTQRSKYLVVGAGTVWAQCPQNSLKVYCISALPLRIRPATSSLQRFHRGDQCHSESDRVVTDKEDGPEASLSERLARRYLRSVD